MHVLILTACLAADPLACADRLLPAAEALDAAGCEAKAEDTAAAWLAAHPDLTGQGWRCEPLARAEALELAEVAPGVHVHRGADAQLSPENRGWIANLGVVVGDSRVAVIDPGGSRAQGEALYAAIRRLTGLPIGPVVLTHMHPDHIAGAEVFAEAGAEIIGDARLPEALDLRRETWAESIPAQIGAAAWAGTVLIGPTRTISGPEVLDLGGRTLELSPVPRAHTDSDLTVRDSATGALFTGDLVFRGLTPVVDGSLKGWLDWNAQPHEGAPVIPGHGPVAGSFTEANAAQRSYLEALRDAVRAALDAGQGLSAAVPAMGVAMTPLADGWADFPATTARNAAAAYAEMEWD
ncbi:MULTISPECIES: quinoprotein relay system zinc metallohydrolase 2 [unclassified Paracoccus (in: a-proteobacteria)]|uniref:quinoprotein relay system zinc metallohydrolase 2 n=1 Tax=unclassified Paracoccus (in: a-proteobacteria) TaxID=2688777 RepID=UPI0016047511|nr:MULTISPECIES: quinoprotein relay system zinc metallohydrolase 2 [unclassified Paracoccus (in: a-proteobacteria)]MBB1491171.1 quinoprotein relay system zinc metallohydrolase 2 [Paracoccus sp. MC1854]MBB1497014.1 quinoprotein relay system zinc metallohydrolase 2 [Paracoccus sp. MC1862]QQO44579.1 quinoprotein relay system zinc metallohydrolase 2 [Paracoccus sp. MC1862]